jgi:hypothetical protein
MTAPRTCGRLKFLPQLNYNDEWLSISRANLRKFHRPLLFASGWAKRGLTMPKLISAGWNAPVEFVVLFETSLRRVFTSPSRSRGAWVDAPERHQKCAQY